MIRFFQVFPVRCNGSFLFLQESMSIKDQKREIVYSLMGRNIVSKFTRISQREYQLKGAINVQYYLASYVKTQFNPKFRGHFLICNSSMTITRE
jgi:hypothetical protein